MAEGAPPAIRIARPHGAPGAASEARTSMPPLFADVQLAPLPSHLQPQPLPSLPSPICDPMSYYTILKSYGMWYGVC